MFSDGFTKGGNGAKKTREATFWCAKFFSSQNKVISKKTSHVQAMSKIFILVLKI